MADSLPSWRDTRTKAAIIDFVSAVTEGPGAVPLEARVAVFDNDGTLWTEKPMPTQLHFIVEQWVQAALADPSLAAVQPYKAAVAGDFSWLAGAVDKHYGGDDSDLKILIGGVLATSANENVEDYEATVAEFFRTAQHLTLNRPYSDIVFRPMVELLRYLEANGFALYMVSGGDRDFMRPIAAEYYGIPRERVVGSAVGMSFDENSNEVRYSTAFDFMDDGPEKPVRIWTRTGRRPLLAAGNSNGDVPMLRFAQGHPRSLSLLVHHDDDTGRGDEPYDKGSEDALAAASEHGFTVVSVKDDWENVFPETTKL